MADTKYTYSIASSFPNKQVNTSTLSSEITGSSISSASLLRIDTTGDVCDIWFNGSLSSGDETILNGLVAAHLGTPVTKHVKGGIVVIALSTPGSPTVTPQGTPGSTTWGYKVSAFSESGETLASSQGQTTSGAATLDGTNFNKVSWSAVSGAVKYAVYRSTSGGNPSSTGKIVETSNLQFDDTGKVASGSQPSEDRSGAVIIGSEGPESAASKILDLIETTTDQATVTSLLAILRRSSNTVQAGFGTGIYVRLEDATDVIRAAGGLHFLWDDPDATDLDSDFRVMVRDGGTDLVERLRVKSSGALQVSGTTVIDQGTCVDALPIDAGVRGGTTSASTNNDVAAIRFDNLGDGWNRVNLRPPRRYTSGNLTFRLLCSIPSSVGAGLGTRWKLSWEFLNVGDDLPANWTYTNEFTYDISNQVLDRIFAIDFTIPAAQFDKTKDLWAIRMDRIGTNAADNCNVHIYLHGLEVRYAGFRYVGE
jgi:hypothetical protein